MKHQTIHLHTPVQESTEAEVREILGDERYQAVKANDPHPFWVTFSAGHEGESRGRLLGRRAGAGVARKRWSAERIRELAARLDRTPVYLFHNADNAPRKKIGEILAAAARELGGRLHAVGVAYIAEPETRRRIRAGELDSCSIEADLEVSRRNRSGSWMVAAVRRVTGLALGSRALAAPGFPGSGLLTAVQEFEPLPSAPDSEAGRLRSQLADQERRAQELRRELERLKRKTKPADETGNLAQALDTALGGRNLTAAENDFVRERVREALNGTPAPNGTLAREVSRRVEKELASLDRLRQSYADSRSFPAPPEPRLGGAGPGPDQPWKTNPLIPKDS